MIFLQAMTVILILLVPSRFLWNRKKRGENTGKKEAIGVILLSLLAAGYTLGLISVGFFL